MIKWIRTGRLPKQIALSLRPVNNTSQRPGEMTQTALENQGRNQSAAEVDRTGQVLQRDRGGFVRGPPCVDKPRLVKRVQVVECSVGPRV